MIWLLASIMLGIALLVILLPLWRSNVARAGLDSDTANVAVLKEQLKELEQEGTDGAYDSELVDQVRKDLQDSVAADLVASQPVTDQVVSANGRWWISGLMVILLPIASVVFYQQVSTFRDVSPAELRTASASPAGNQQEQPSIEAMVEVLAARLRDDPENAEGWAMLGKTYVVLQRFREAVAAYEKAYQLAGEGNAELTLDYAEVLAFANGDKMAGKPEELLEKAFKLKPDLPKAIWLSGFAYFQRADYASAHNAWGRLLSRPGVPEETRTVLSQYMAQARELGGLAATDTQPVQNSEAAAVIEVQVSLHESIADKVLADEAVFVFARSLTGPPMPLAVKKIRVADLPATIRLDESMAMIEGHSLADKEQVVVGARVSKAGTPIPQSGDFQGMSGTIDPRTTAKIAVVIKQPVE